MRLLNADGAQKVEISQTDMIRFETKIQLN